MEDQTMVIKCESKKLPDLTSLITFAFVGNIFLLSFHAKDLTLFGIFSLHIVFQNIFPFSSFDAPPKLLPILESIASLQALRTMKLPLGVQAHTNRSSDNLVLKGMLNIALVSSEEKKNYESYQTTKLEYTDQ